MPLLYLLGCLALAPADNTIVVRPNIASGTFNPRVLGSNQLSYDVDYKRTGKIQTGYTCRGSGLWDPEQRAPVPELVELAQGTGCAISRFPGGCGTHTFDWHKTVGPLDQRPQWQFGLPEFLRWCEAVGSDVVLTVSYFIGDAADAADLVEYLNAPLGTNPNGGREWAKLRAEDGHPEPYGLTWFEFGNEVYHGNHNDIAKVAPEDYARRFNESSQAMKAVDPTIKLGAILGNSPWGSPHEVAWTPIVLPLVKDRADFLIDHHYPPFSSPGRLASPDEQVAVSFAGVELMAEKLQAVKAYCREVVGHELPLAITEFNAGYARLEDPPLRHCLGAALVCADLLRLYSQPGNQIEMANYWQFANSYWGQVKGEAMFDGGGQHIRRPNYYPHELYAKHFGPRLVACEATGARVPNPKLGLVEARRGEGRTEAWGDQNLLADCTWRIQPVDGVVVAVEDGVVSLDFQTRQDVNYFHTSTTAEVKPNQWYEARAEIRTAALECDSGLRLAIGDRRGWTVTHSQASSPDLRGDHDWTTLKVQYQTLPETTSVDLILRRLGQAAKPMGDISGRAWVRHLTLREYTPPELPGLPALAPNASLSEDGRTLYLIVLNRNLAEPGVATLDLGGFLPRTGTAWVLSGASAAANNEQEPDSVQLVESPVAVTTPLSFTFPAASLTALEFTR